jgi:hypothetical protein
VIRSDATSRDPDRSYLDPFLARWPLPPLIATTAALATFLVGLVLAGSADRGTPGPNGPVLRAGRLAPVQAQRASAQATADRFAQTFARSLQRPVATSELRAAGASAELARRITAERSGPAPAGRRARSSTATAGSARAIDVTVRADHGGWLATATVLLNQPGAPTADAQRPSLTFRLERHPGVPDRLVVVDANPGGRE